MNIIPSEDEMNLNNYEVEHLIYLVQTNMTNEIMVTAE